MPLQTKKKYQYPGWHDENTAGNVLYFAENIESLPHYSGPHFLWSDIQLSKSSTTKNNFTMQINLKSEHLHYWLSWCNGVRRCGQCNHVLPRSFILDYWTGILEWTTGLTFFLVLHIFKVGLLYIWVACNNISTLSGEYDTKK